MPPAPTRQICQVFHWSLKPWRSCHAGEAESAAAKVVELESLAQEREGLIARLEEDLLAARPGTKPEAKEPTFLGTDDRSEAGGETLVATVEMRTMQVCYECQDSLRCRLEYRRR